jgi:hypothetical protein
MIVVAEFVGSYSVTYDFVVSLRGSKSEFDYTWEERWLREEGYSKSFRSDQRSVQKIEYHDDDVQKLVFPCIFKAEHRAIGKKLGATPDKWPTPCTRSSERPRCQSAAEAGRGARNGKAGDGILLAGFGQDVTLCISSHRKHINADRAGLKDRWPTRSPRTTT